MSGCADVANAHDCAMPKPLCRTRLLLLPLLTATLVVAACGTTVRGRSSSPTPLRVVSYNIKHGRGNDDTVDLERTARVLRAQNPDIVALQEVDERVRRSGSVPQADSLGRLLGMSAAFGGFMDYQGGQYGMAILSRYPIVSINPIRLPNGNEHACRRISAGDPVHCVPHASFHRMQPRGRQGARQDRG